MRETHTFLRKELRYLQQVSYCASLIEQTTEIETPIPILFDLLKSLLGELGTQPPVPQTILAFEFKLLSELGLKPELDRSRLSSDSKEIVKAFTENAWSAILCQSPNESQIRELQQFLHGFMIYHLGKIPKGRTI